MATRRRKRNTVMISYVAERYEIHPQTLRTYEREGLLKPIRSAGNTRLYDEATLRRLETILTLTRDMGVNLAGVDVILNLQDQLQKLEQEKEQLLQALEKRERDRRAGIRRRHALVKVDRGPLMKIDD
ncbi:MAG: MerR family transcriptional regulator [Acidobacteriota bacterium]